MIWSLLGALASSVCFGVATVMQAVAARRTRAGEGVDPRLLVRLVSQLPYVLGVGLDLFGFALELAALRSLPLFVVQAIIAANLAVTAIVAARVMRIRLTTAEWTAVGAVCVGLALLGLTAGEENAAHVSLAVRWGLLGAAVLTLLAGLAAGRLRGEAMAVVLGALAGLGFGLVAIGARAIESLALLDLLRDPALYTLGVGGLASLLFFVTALQKGSVTAATAASVVVETVVPSAIGIWLLGDHTRPGTAPFAVAGFLIAVTGTLLLARFGEPAPAETPEHANTPA